MIGQLKGVIAALDEETMLIDVGGVGYEVYGFPRMLQKLSLGAAASFAIETVVREDFIKLYGFENAAERRCFRLLQSVQGVGAKHALAVLQVLPPAALYDAIAAEDVTAVSRAHGVGKKIAQRIVTELQSKLGALADLGSALGATSGSTSGSGAAFTRQARASMSEKENGAQENGGGDGNNGTNHNGAARADAVSALVNLGYDGVDARRAVSAAAGSAGEEAGVSMLITHALKQLAPAS